MDDLQKARLAQNEDFFREVNERINENAESHGSDSHRYEFFCECSDATCVERVLMTLLEYEHIRAEPTRFVVKKYHVIREVEHVVRRFRTTWSSRSMAKQDESPSNLKPKAAPTSGSR